MKPQSAIGRTITADGRELVLYERDGVYTIRVGGFELMSSRSHGSEEALARLTLARCQRRRRPRILVGGLGMGYTLRAVLDRVPSSARIEVAEVLDCVIEWNRAALADLAGKPLEDRRVVLLHEDVARVMDRHRATFDAILLDIDNGPAALTLAENDAIYSVQGLAAIHRSLRDHGVLGLWAADPDPAFLSRLSKSGFDATSESVFARRIRKGPKHTIFVASKR